jgi:hypothetical protein
VLSGNLVIQTKALARLGPLLGRVPIPRYVVKVNPAPLGLQTTSGLAAVFDLTQAMSGLLGSTLPQRPRCNVRPRNLRTVPARPSRRFKRKIHSFLGAA